MQGYRRPIIKELLINIINLHFPSKYASKKCVRELLCTLKFIATISYLYLHQEQALATKVCLRFFKFLFLLNMYYIKTLQIPFLPSHRLLACILQNIDRDESKAQLKFHLQLFNSFIKTLLMNEGRLRKQCKRN